MNGSERALTIRRILVALDASPHSLSALEAAAELAASFQAELLGLFIEDINLLRSAEMPFAQEVGLASGRLRRLDSQLVERQLQARANQARRAMAAAAERARVRWSFETASGQIVSRLLAAALDVDILILGKAGWSGQRRLGSHARAVISQQKGPTLVLQHGVHLELPVLVLYDGSAATQRSLAAAAQLVQERGGYLVLLLLAESLQRAHDLEADLASQLRDQLPEIRYRWLTSADVATLCQAIHSEGGGVLVLHPGTPSLDEETLASLLSEASCPVLVVR
jgi:nucleotide-binding universal stress UspA family protein